MRYTRILTPVDGSKLAEQVLPYVRVMAKGLQARVQLLHVFETEPSSVLDPTQVAHPGRMIGSVRDQVQRNLEEVATAFRSDGLTASYSADEGDVASCIVDEAEKEPGTLIAMSTHGRSGVTRWVLGSVTDKVIHVTARPVLVIRAQDEDAPTPDVKLETIIVPLDGSSLAEQALPHVAAIAKELDLTVSLVRVNTSLQDIYLYTGYAFPGYKKLVDDMDAQAADYLRKVSGRLRQEGLSSVEEHVLLGHAASAIVDFAREVQNNIVAMTTHGRSGLGRWILGSVAERVVKYSGDPVLVVRAVQEPSSEA